LSPPRRTKVRVNVAGSAQLGSAAVEDGQFAGEEREVERVRTVRSDLQRQGLTDPDLQNIALRVRAALLSGVSTIVSQPLPATSVKRASIE
jgi:hypothetical protein